MILADIEGAAGIEGRSEFARVNEIMSERVDGFEWVNGFERVKGVNEFE